MDIPPHRLSLNPDISKLKTYDRTALYVADQGTDHNSFSAIAELVDNSRDAGAHWCHINITGDCMNERMEILDDGEGMTREEAMNLIETGPSLKKNDTIGRFGCGLKSGGFYLGRDVLLLTKKEEQQTAIFLSHTFQEVEFVYSNVYVLSPSTLNGKPCPDNPEEIELFEAELAFIYRIAPLERDETLQDLFDKIKGPHGTLVIVFRLNRDSEGMLEMRVRGNDICIKGEPYPPHKTQLREYLKILYLIPQMNITLCGEIVAQRKIVQGWMGRCFAEIDPPNHHTDGFRMFITESKRKLEKTRRKYANWYSSINGAMHTSMSNSQREALHQKNVVEKEAFIREISEQTKTLENRMAAYKKVKIRLCFGLEVEHRARNGIHFFINNRLVQWSYHSPLFMKDDYLQGVSVYCELYSDYFRPNSIKQGFDNEEDFSWITNQIEERLVKYQWYLESMWIPEHLKNNWRCTLSADEDVWKVFWKKYGYDESHDPFEETTREPFNEEQTKNLEKECGIWRYCALCGGWRELDASSNLKNLPIADFRCSLVIKNGFPLVCFTERRRSVWENKEASINLEEIQLPAPPAPPDVVILPSSAPTSALAKALELRECKIEIDEDFEFDQPTFSHQRHIVDDWEETMTERRNSKKRSANRSSSSSSSSAPSPHDSEDELVLSDSDVDTAVETSGQNPTSQRSISSNDSKVSDDRREDKKKKKNTSSKPVKDQRRQKNQETVKMSKKMIKPSQSKKPPVSAKRRRYATSSSSSSHRVGRNMEETTDEDSGSEKRATHRQSSKNKSGQKEKGLEAKKKSTTARKSSKTPVAKKTSTTKRSKVLPPSDSDSSPSSDDETQEVALEKYSSTKRQKVASPEPVRMKKANSPIIPVSMSLEEIEKVMKALEDCTKREKQNAKKRNKTKRNIRKPPSESEQDSSDDDKSIVSVSASVEEIERVMKALEECTKREKKNAKKRNKTKRNIRQPLSESEQDSDDDDKSIVSDSDSE